MASSFIDYRPPNVRITPCVAGSLSIIGERDASNEADEIT